MGADNGREARKLVARCEAVGWSVVRNGSDHFKVDTRKGTFIIPSTPGDNRSMKNTLAEAKRLGLEELEAKLAITTESERRARIDADRAKNDAKLAQITQVNNAALGAGKDLARDVGFGFVDDVAVVAVAPAMMQTPIMPKPGPLTDAEELLLADGRVLYRCTRHLIDAGGREIEDLCHGVFNSPNGARNHLVAHRRAEAKRSVKAVTVTTTTPTDGRELLIEDVEKTMAMLNSLGVDITKFYDEFGGRILELREVSTQLLERIKAFTVPVAETDPELLRKAAGLDALAAQLKGLMQ